MKVFHPVNLPLRLISLESQRNRILGTFYERTPLQGFATRQQESEVVSPKPESLWSQTEARTAAVAPEPLPRLLLLRHLWLPWTRVT